MFCPNCGNRITPADKFCVKCGTAISNSSSQPQTQNAMAGSNPLARRKNYSVSVLLAFLIMEFLLIILVVAAHDPLVITVVNIILGLFFMGAILWLLLGMVLGVIRIVEANKIKQPEDRSRLKTIGTWHIISPFIFIFSIILIYVIVQVVYRTTLPN